MTKQELRMLKWLGKGIRRATRTRAPSEGSLCSLFYGDLDKDGGHWQVDLVHDQRFRPKPWVAVYWWPKDGKTGSLSMMEVK